VNSWQETIPSLRGKTFLEKRKAFDKFYHLWNEEKDGPFPVWGPTVEEIKKTNIFSVMSDLKISSYPKFYSFSVNNRPEFWQKTLEKIGVVYKKKYDAILDLSQGIEQPKWLSGAKLNIADSCFKADPQKIAIISQSENGPIKNTTYGELNALSNKVANGLMALSLKKGDAIAIDMSMNMESVAIYLGIVKAGMVVVSIADSFAPDEIATRLRISKAKLIFTQDYLIRGGKSLPLLEKVKKSSDIPCIVLYSGEKITDRSFLDFIGPQSESFQSIAMSPDDFSNILFSSGTTGDPKAIPWSHSTPLKCAADGFYHQDIKSTDIVCWPTNLGWMMGPWLIYATLINNSTMAIFEGLPSGIEFGEFILAAKVSILGVVPSIVKTWKNTNVMNEGHFAYLKCFSSTGECSNFDDYFYLMSLANFRPVVEYCGGTEIGGSYIGGNLVQASSPGSFSGPILGLDFKILDENGNDCDEGELFIIPPSIGLSTVLLNSDHHKVYFEGTPNHLRRHGDRVKKLPNGYFKGQGRADDTMNLGGIKTSSAEIERVLNKVDGVLETAAIAVEPKSGGASLLVIFAVLKTEIPRDEVQKIFQIAIREKLNPLFKIYDVVLVPALPRTASNKVIRRALRSTYQI
jgi:acetyl-CoA synthetase